MRQLHIRTIVLVLLAGMAVGCSTEEPPEKVKQASNMRALANAYGRFIRENRGRPPKNEQQLRKFIESLGAFFLEQFDAESVDEIFTSSRDGKPYIVVYGKRAKIVAYEQEGADGTRFVVTDLGSTEEMDETRFREAVPDAD